ncbi:hypothetical protein B0H11DRAFT_2253244 [Mycena galericulata]|nr:hypothetical protein B0H11DRAFT_2253244 [Mycena galericulata]
MSTAAASASTGSGCSLVVSAGNSSQDLRLDLELPAPSIDWMSCCSHKRTSEQEEFEKTASLCARFRVQGEAGFGHCVLGIESGSLLYHLSTYLPRIKTSDPVATLLCPRNADLTSSPRIASVAVEATLLFPRYADLTRSVRSRSFIHQILSSNIRTAAPASPLDVHDATQDFVAHRRRSPLPLSTICRLDAVTAPVSLLDVHDTIQDLGAPPRRSHVAVSMICRVDQQRLHHLWTSATRLETSEAIAVEATSLSPRYADLTRSVKSPVSLLDVHDTLQDLGAPRSRSHVAVSTICRLDQRLHHLSTSVTRFKTSQPIAVEATSLSPRYADLTRSVKSPVSLLDVHDTLQDLGAPRSRSHVAVSRICRLDEIPAPVSLLDVCVAIQDPRRRRHVAVSTICRLDQQRLHHIWTSATRLETSEAIAVEATLLFPRYADLTRSACITSRPPASPLDVRDTIQDLGAQSRRSHVTVSTICRLDARLHHLSTSVTRLKTSQPIAVEATSLSPRYTDLTRSVTSRSFLVQILSSNIPTTAPASPLDVRDTIQDLGAQSRRSHLANSPICRLDEQPLYHFSTSTTRFKTSEPIAVEATLLFPRYADLTRSQPLYHFSTFVSRFKTLAVEGTLLFPRYADLTRPVKISPIFYPNLFI